MHEAFCFWSYADCARGRARGGLRDRAGLARLHEPVAGRAPLRPGRDAAPGGRARARRCRGRTRTCGSSPGGPRREARARPGVRGAGRAVDAAAVGAGVRPAGLGRCGATTPFHGSLHTEGGPTWKPLSVLGTTLLAPLDRDAEPRVGGARADGRAARARGRVRARRAARGPARRGGRRARDGAQPVVAAQQRARQLRGLARRRGAVERARAPRRAPPRGARARRRRRPAAAGGVAVPRPLRAVAVRGRATASRRSPALVAIGVAGCCPTRSARTACSPPATRRARPPRRAPRSSPTCRSSPCCGTPSSSSASSPLPFAVAALVPWRRASPVLRVMALAGGRLRADRRRHRAGRLRRQPALPRAGRGAGLRARRGRRRAARRSPLAVALAVALAITQAGHLRRDLESIDWRAQQREQLDVALARAGGVRGARARAATCSRATTGARSSPRGWTPTSPSSTRPRDGARRARPRARRGAAARYEPDRIPARPDAPRRGARLGDLDGTARSLIGWAHGRRSGHQGLDPRHRRRHAARPPLAHRRRA